MNNVDQYFVDTLKNIKENGIWCDNRTGIKTKTIPFSTFTHNMADGFPLLCIKKTPYKVIKVELEGFINGITSKKWFQERGCNIWNEWCNPEKVPYGIDKETQQKMYEEDDLGLIYGSQYRNFHDPEAGIYGAGYDQLKGIVRLLKKDPSSRRMVCSAWNPLAMGYMALMPCHYVFQVQVIDNTLHLNWTQRSTDVPLGQNYNIASYATMLHLLAKEGGFREGILCGQFSNLHYYENQQVGVDEILSRNCDIPLSKIETNNFTSIFDWHYYDTNIIGYESLFKINIPIAI